MNDIIFTIKVEEIRFSGNKINEYKKNILKDKTLKLVLQYYKNGWHKCVKKLAKKSELLHYSKLKNNITMEGGLIYWNNRLLIPKKLHSGVIYLYT